MLYRVIPKTLDISINENDDCRITILPHSEHSLQLSPVLTPIVNTDPHMIEIREINKKSIFISISNFLITVEELKNIINKKLNYPIDQIQLYCNGRYIENSYSLHDYNITYKSIIHIISKLDNDTVKSLTNQDYFVINID